MTLLQIQLLKYIGFTATIALLAYGIYSYGKHVQFNEDEVKRQADVIAQQEADTKTLLQYAEFAKQGVEQHAKDSAIIAANNAELTRMRGLIPTLQVTTTVAGCESVYEASRQLSARIQSSFDRFQQRVTGIIQECETVNADAIRLNTSLGLTEK